VEGTTSDVAWKVASRPHTPRFDWKNAIAAP
jgi:hypothetical protein